MGADDYAAVVAHSHRYRLAESSLGGDVETVGGFVEDEQRGVAS